MITMSIMSKMSKISKIYTIGSKTSIFWHDVTKLIVLNTAILLVCSMAPLGQSATRNNNKIVDRVVVSINNFPFTQLQIESYMLVKEGLRKDPENSQLVDQTNWTAARQAFVNDMIVFLEAAKTSGFKPQKSTTNKVIERFNGTIKQQTKFSQAIQKLDVDAPTIQELINKILTIESYRKSKQPTDELFKSAVVRWYDHSDHYSDLQPGKTH
jgi:hypothetical protein